MSKRHRERGFFSGLVLGLVAGAGLLHYLTKTPDGRKLRDKWLKKGRKTLDQLGEAAQELEEKGKAFTKRTKEIQTELEEKAKDVKREVSQEAKEQLKQVKSIQEKGRQTAHLFFTKNGRSLTKKKTSKKK